MDRPLLSSAHIRLARIEKTPLSKEWSRTGRDGAQLLQYLLNLGDHRGMGVMGRAHNVTTARAALELT